MQEFFGSIIASQPYMACIMHKHLMPAKWLKSGLCRAGFCRRNTWAPGFSRLFSEAFRADAGNDPGRRAWVAVFLGSDIQSANSDRLQEGAIPQSRCFAYRGRHCPVNYSYRSKMFHTIDRSGVSVFWEKDRRMLRQSANRNPFRYLVGFDGVLVAAIVLFGLSVGETTKAFTATVVRDVGPLHVEADFPETIGLAEVLEIRITIAGPTDIAIRWPRPAERWSDMKILSSRQEGPDEFQGEKGRLQVLRYFLKLEPPRLGAVPLEEFTFDYAQRPAGDEPPRWNRATISLPPISVVTQSPGSDDPSTLREIPDLPPLSGTNAWRQRWATGFKVAGGVILVVVIVVALWRRGQSQPSSTDGLSPRDSALQGVNRLAVLLPAGDTTEWPHGRTMVGEANELIRGYLEKRYGTPTGVETTPELLADRSLDRLGGEGRDHLRGFLSAADHRRFGGDEPTAAETRDVIDSARLFLEAEEPQAGKKS